MSTGRDAGGKAAFGRSCDAMNAGRAHAGRAGASFGRRVPIEGRRVKNRRAFGICAAALTALTLAGCAAGGGSSAGGGGASASATPGRPSSAALVRQVSATVRRATSVHLSARVRQSGRRVRLNASLTRAGDFYGTVSVGAPVSVLVTHGKSYAKLNSAFLRSQNLPTAACALLCGKWLKLTRTEAKALFAGQGWASLVGWLDKIPGLTYAGAATVDGTPAWKEKVAGGGVAYVAAASPHYVLRLVQGANRLDFSHWNAATIPGPPPASEVTDLAHLVG